jgi:RecA-family ATPase
LEIPQKRTILNPWLREESIILISGWRGTGKTWFALSLCDSITRWQGFGPWPLTNGVDCLYVDGEMTANDVQERLLALDRMNGTGRRSSFVIYSDAYANGLGISKANLRSERWRKELKTLLVERGIRLVCFDNIASLSPGIDENVKQAWDPINQYLLDLRFEGITSILLHHTNKAGDQRGTSAREDNIDISITLVQPSDYTNDQGARFVVRFRKTRISSKDLALLQDNEFQLVETNGQIQWTWGSVRRKNKAEILRMIDEGVQQVDIGRSLGIDKGYVSRVKSQAMKDGHLTAKGKLTQTGFMEVNEGENEAGI